MFLSLRFGATALAAAILPLAAQTPSGIDLRAIDRAVNPCNDFYQYACGTWMRDNPIPPDQATWGRFPQLVQRNREILRNILEKAAVQRAGRTPAEQKIGDYYESCIDEDAVEKKGAAPVEPDLARIAKLGSSRQLAEEVARQHLEGTDVFFRFTDTQDPKDASQTIAQLSQGGLSLPDRDYYLKTDAKSVETRAAFLAHVTKMFELAGHTSSQASAEARAVMNVETALAKVSADRVALRDPQKRDNRKTVRDLDAMAPLFDWSAYLKAISLKIEYLNVGVPDFVKGINRVIADTSLDNLRTYLAWHVLDEAAPLLRRPS